jgi:3'(2'), 5'-bisphosphate nucleotidase
MNMKNISEPDIASLSTMLHDAGQAVMEIYGSSFSVEQKEDSSPLTVADRISHEIVTSYLKKSFPFPVLSEEGKNIPYEKRKDWEAFWLVDPLDGTKEFIRRNGEFTINVALIRNGSAVAGAIYVPARHVLYYGQTGRGAFKNEAGTTLRLPLQKKEEHLIVVGSRSHGSEGFLHYIRTLEGRHGRVEIVPAGSSLKFCLVAEGQAHLYPRMGTTMEWDTAAGQVIVEEAGGRVFELGSSRTLQYNKKSLANPHFIAAGGHLPGLQEMPA